MQSTNCFRLLLVCALALLLVGVVRGTQIPSVVVSPGDTFKHLIFNEYFPSSCTKYTSNNPSVKSFSSCGLGMVYMNECELAGGRLPSTTTFALSTLPAESNVTQSLLTAGSAGFNLEYGCFEGSGFNFFSRSLSGFGAAPNQQWYFRVSPKSVDSCGLSGGGTGVNFTLAAPSSDSSDASQNFGLSFGCPGEQFDMTAEQVSPGVYRLVVPSSFFQQHGDGDYYITYRNKHNRLPFEVVGSGMFAGFSDSQSRSDVSAPLIHTIERFH